MDMDWMVGLLFGACVGSFAGCLAWRIPRQLPPSGRSRCPVCAAPIGWYWNIPVLSFLLLRGRARCCGSRLSWAYPAWEAGGALTGAGLGWACGVWWACGVLTAAALAGASWARRHAGRRR